MHVQVRDQIEGLEDEADLLVADARTLVVVHAADVDPVELSSCPPLKASSRPAMVRKVVLPEPEGR